MACVAATKPRLWLLSNLAAKIDHRLHIKLLANRESRIIPTASVRMLCPSNWRHSQPIFPAKRPVQYSPSRTSLTILSAPCLLLIDGLRLGVVFSARRNFQYAILGLGVPVLVGRPGSLPFKLPTRSQLRNVRQQARLQGVTVQVGRKRTHFICLEI
jgi:hypothetical protein